MACVQITDLIIKYKENDGYYLDEAIPEEIPVLEVKSEDDDDEAYAEGYDSENSEHDPKLLSERKYFQKYLDLEKKGLLFSLDNKQSIVKLDNKTRNVTTPEPIAESIAQKFIHSLKLAYPERKSFVIMDAFCGIGGNTIQFAKHDLVSSVYAIDCDPKKISIAKKMAKLYGCCDKIKFFTDDFCRLIRKKHFSLSVDACFLGLPWCWKKTSKYSLHEMSPDGFKIVHLAADLVTCNLGVSLPLNYFKAELTTLNNTVYDHFGSGDDYGGGGGDSYDDDEDNDDYYDDNYNDDDDSSDDEEEGDEEDSDDDDNGYVEEEVPYYIDMYQIEKYHNISSMIVYFGDLVNTSGRYQRNKTYYPAPAQSNL